MSILNLTQHQASPEQIEAGVVDLTGDDRTSLLHALNFAALPSAETMRSSAEEIAALARVNGATSAMIGGAPFLMAPLERALRAEGIEPLYAFSARESAEQAQPDGSVLKVTVFRHLGFVPAVAP